MAAESSRATRRLLAAGILSAGLAGCVIPLVLGSPAPRATAGPGKASPSPGSTASSAPAASPGPTATPGPDGFPGPTASPSPSATPATVPFPSPAVAHRGPEGDHPLRTRELPEFLTGPVLILELSDAATGQRIPQAAISLQGPTLAGGVWIEQGDPALGPLAPGSYRLRVAVPGYVTKVRTLEIAGRPTQGQSTPEIRETISLTPGAGSVTGRVQVRGSGAPVAGARVHGGDDIAYTAADGTFRLEGLTPGEHVLTIRKTGYQAAVTQVVQTGTDVGSVGLATGSLVVNFAGPSGLIGGGASGGSGAFLLGLEVALRAAGARVQHDDPAGATIQIVAAPAASAASWAALAQTHAWVAGGGKLVVMGEWGGLAGYSPEAADALVHPAGLAFEADLVRSSRNAGNADWPIGTPAGPWPWPLGEVGLFRSGSVFMVPPGQAVLKAQGAYRVAGILTRDPVLAAVAPLGDGLVAAVGDTSAWSDTNTTGTGPDLGYKDNRSYVVNLILW